VQELLFPESSLAPFDVSAARTAARIYRAVKNPRSREFDIAIAACAIEHGTALWTLNPADFRDIPGLTLYAGS
jgi:predicted nucleic acid-binding protein